MLPQLSALSLHRRDDEESSHSWKEWIAAVTEGKGIASRPKFKSWKALRGDDKQDFYKLVDESENDRFSMGQYDTPYTGDDIDVVLKSGTWSIEHVLPRLFVNGRDAGEAEDDWLGWDVADRDANSARSALPLVLWPMPSTKVGRVRIGREIHFNPLEEHKARLARRWLFLRATYSKIDSLTPPSRAQKRHAKEILEHVRDTRIGYAEERFQLLLQQYIVKRFDTAWTNPLYGTDARKYLEDAAWRALVFGPA